MPRRRLLPLLLVLGAVAAATLAAAPPAAAGGGCHRPPSQGRGETLTLTELCFSPTVLRVPAGTEVQLVNRDGLTHPLGRPGGDWYWEGNAGDHTSVKLDASGVYPFFCYQHPGMVGVVVVGDGSGTAAGGGAVVDAAVAEASPTVQAAPARPASAAVPPAWLLVVALAALVGAAGGARLATRRSSL